MCVQCFDQKKILKKMWSEATEVEGTNKRLFLINSITDEHVTLTFEELEKFTKRHIIRDLHDLRNAIYDTETQKEMKTKILLHPDLVFVNPRTGHRFSPNIIKDGQHGEFEVEITKEMVQNFIDIFNADGITFHQRPL